MKRALVLMLAVLAMEPGGLAQDKIVFRANLSYEQQYNGKPTPLAGHALFTLDGIGLFSGHAEINNATENTGVMLARVTSPAEPSFWTWQMFPLASYTHETPNGNISGWSYTTGRVWTGDDLADIKAGNWWVDVVSPSGSIRGQIMPVPEPSTWALLLVPALAWWWRRNWKRERAMRR